MKIVFLDSMTLGDDISLERFKTLGDTIIYETTKPEEAAERIREADVIVSNKVRLNADNLSSAANVKLICVTATGTDVIDKEYTNTRGIQVANVASYSTASVAQHTFALLFYLLEHLEYFDNYVKTEQYSQSPIFCDFGQKFYELDKKTWGIIGLGEIGRAVARIAQSFGCRVIYYSTSGRNHNPDYEQVTLDELLTCSDVVSIHAPLNENTKGLMNLANFRKMKKTAYLINVGRGPIVVEKDLIQALEQGLLAGAGLDVVSTEPLPLNSPLYRMQDSGKLIITPHIAWASKEARERLVERTYENIVKYSRLF